MKKLSFLFILALVLGAGQAYAIDEPTIRGWKNKSDQAQHTWDQTTILKFVRNGQMGANTTSIQSGDAVVYSAFSDDGVSVMLTTTSADGGFAGIAVTPIPTCDQSSVTTWRDDIGRRNWGWVLVHGKTFAKVTAGGSNGHAAGDFFITSADSGAITTISNRANATLPVTAGGAREIAASGGIFLDAATAANTVEEVFVRAE